MAPHVRSVRKENSLGKLLAFLTCFTTGFRSASNYIGQLFKWNNVDPIDYTTQVGKRKLLSTAGDGEYVDCYSPASRTDLEVQFQQSDEVISVKFETEIFAKINLLCEKVKELKNCCTRRVNGTPPNKNGKKNKKAVENSLFERNDETSKDNHSPKLLQCAGGNGSKSSTKNETADRDSKQSNQTIGQLSHGHGNNNGGCEGDGNGPPEKKSNGLLKGHYRESAAEPVENKDGLKCTSKLRLPMPESSGKDENGSTKMQLVTSSSPDIDTVILSGQADNHFGNVSSIMNGRESSVSDRYEWDWDESGVKNEHESSVTDQDESMPDQHYSSVTDRHESSVTNGRESNVTDGNESNVKNEHESSMTDQDESSVIDGRESNATDRNESSVTYGRESNVTDRNESSVTYERESNVTDRNESSVTDSNESSVTYRRESNVTDRNESSVTDSNESSVTDRNESSVTNGHESNVTDGNESSVTNGHESNATDRDESSVTNGHESDVTNGNESSVTYGHESSVTDRDESSATNGHESDVTDGNESSVTYGLESNVTDRNSLKVYKILHPFQSALSVSICDGVYRLERDFKIVREICSGRFGVCFEILDIRSGKKFAMKQILYKRFDVNELTIWSKLTSNRNVVLLLGAYHNGEHVRIFMELMDGTLKYIANNSEALRITDRKVAAVMKPVLKVLASMHDQGYVHFDIKPDNILIGHSGIKLSDFGLTVDRSETTGNIGPRGTVPYMPKELFCGGKCGASADIYAAGCTMLHLLSGFPPWSGFIQDAIIWKVCWGETPEVPSNCSEQMKSALKCMLQSDHEERPTARKILLHPLFSDSPESVLDDVLQKVLVDVQLLRNQPNDDLAFSPMTLDGEDEEYEDYEGADPALPL